MSSAAPNTAVPAVRADEHAVFSVLDVLKHLLDPNKGGIQLDDDLQVNICHAIEMAQALLPGLGVESSRNNKLAPILQSLVAEITDDAVPYIREAQERRLKAQRDERVELIASVLFPKYDCREVASGRTTRPPIHPDCEFWWNGATVTGYDANERSEKFTLRVTSYVGGGNTKEFETHLPWFWLKAPDVQTVIHAWIRDETAARAEKKRLQDIANATYELHAQAACLAVLHAAAPASNATK